MNDGDGDDDSDNNDDHRTTMTMLIVLLYFVQMPFLREFNSKWSDDEDISHKERCLAYVFLTFIGSAYVWQQGESDRTREGRVGARLPTATNSAV